MSWSTPPSPSVVIDFHTHILPPQWPDLAARFDDPRWPRIEHLDDCSANILLEGRVFRRVGRSCYEAERRLEDMDRVGVDHQVLSPVPVMFSYWADGVSAHELSAHLNDHIADVIRDHPDRFAGLATVPLQDPRRATEELQRCVGELGLAGVEIGTTVAGEDLSAARFEEFFTCAEQLGAVVFVHPWQGPSAKRLSDFYFPYTIGMPAETTYAFGALVFSGLLERHPGLRVVFAHAGGCAPYLIGRMTRGWEIHEPARQRLSQSPMESIRRCWFDSIAGDPHSLELLVARVGSDRVVLGSDYPFIMGEARPGELLERTSLSAAQKTHVLGATSAALLEKSSPASLKQRA
jgi:aminocarboxymuconate-semialdehyde decarboxylase